jgi:isopentenyl diphosphate isomerase/L-lactate dehydrogenase-like FMN-dependent dehydrogenase
MADKAVTEKRKREHIETVLSSDVAAKGVTTGFDRFFFEHAALPELSLDDIDLSCDLFGKRLDAPLLISSMTGGGRIPTACARSPPIFSCSQMWARFSLITGMGWRRFAAPSI